MTSLVLEPREDPDLTIPAFLGPPFRGVLTSRNVTEGACLCRDGCTGAEVPESKQTCR